MREYNNIDIADYQCYYTFVEKIEGGMKGEQI